MLVYKFPRMTLEEIAAMFGQQELEQTRFYQDILNRGQLKAKREVIPDLLVLGLELGWCRRKSLSSIASD